MEQVDQRKATSPRANQPPVRVQREVSRKRGAVYHQWAQGRQSTLEGQPSLGQRHRRMGLLWVVLDHSTQPMMKGQSAGLRLDQWKPLGLVLDQWRPP